MSILLKLILAIIAAPFLFTIAREVTRNSFECLLYDYTLAGLVFGLAVGSIIGVPIVGAIIGAAIGLSKRVTPK